MTKVIKSKEVIEGFEDDFFNIVEEYSQSSTALAFREFLIFWNDNHLDYLFANRFDPREISEVIIKMNQLLVDVVADTTSSGFTTIQRVVALYFILCLFVKQPDRFRRKIRLTCEDAIEIQKLEAQHQHTYHDISFVWNQLRKRGAINLVEERHIFGPSLLNKRGLKDGSSYITKQSVAAGETSKLLDIEQILEESIRMHKTYQELKETLMLDESSIELETNGGNLGDFLDRAKNLLSQYKHTITHQQLL